MTTNARPKPISEHVAEKILNQTEATFGLWERQGYCPCCIARSLLVSAGLLASHEIRPEDMRDVLGYIAMQSEKHAPPDGTVRH